MGGVRFVEREGGRGGGEVNGERGGEGGGECMQRGGGG
jgi:hypothetical protein